MLCWSKNEDNCAEIGRRSCRGCACNVKITDEEEIDEQDKQTDEKNKIEPLDYFDND
jgi:hypothetical protein